MNIIWKRTKKITHKHSDCHISAFVSNTHTHTYTLTYYMYHLSLSFRSLSLKHSPPLPYNLIPLLLSFSLSSSLFLTLGSSSLPLSVCRMQNRCNEKNRGGGRKLKWWSVKTRLNASYLHLVLPPDSLGKYCKN